MLTWSLGEAKYEVISVFNRIGLQSSEHALQKHTISLHYVNENIGKISFKHLLYNKINTSWKWQCIIQIEGLSQVQSFAEGASVSDIHCLWQFNSPSAQTISFSERAKPKLRESSRGLDKTREFTPTGFCSGQYWGHQRLKKIPKD